MERQGPRRGPEPAGGPRSGSQQHRSDERDFRPRQGDRGPGRGAGGEWGGGRGRGGGRGGGRDVEGHHSTRQAGPHVPVPRVPTPHSRLSGAEEHARSGPQNLRQVVRRPESQHQQEGHPQLAAAVAQQGASAATRSAPSPSGPGALSWAALVAPPQQAVQPSGAAPAPLSAGPTYGSGTATDEARRGPAGTHQGKPELAEPKAGGQAGSATAAATKPVQSPASPGSGREDVQDPALAAAQRVSHSVPGSPRQQAADAQQQSRPTLPGTTAATAAAAQQQPGQHTALHAAPRSWASLLQRRDEGPSVHARAPAHPTAVAHGPSPARPPGQLPSSAADAPIAQAQSEGAAAQQVQQLLLVPSALEEQQQRPASVQETEPADIGAEGGAIDEQQAAQVQEQAAREAVPSAAQQAVAGGGEPAEEAASGGEVLSAALQAPAAPHFGLAMMCTSPATSPRGTPEQQPAFRPPPALLPSPRAFTFIRPGGHLMRQGMASGSLPAPMHLPEPGLPAGVMVPAGYVLPQPAATAGSMAGVQPPPAYQPLPHLGPAVPMMPPPAAWGAPLPGHPGAPLPMPHGVWARPSPLLMGPPHPGLPHVRGPPFPAPGQALLGQPLPQHYPPGTPVLGPPPHGYPPPAMGGPPASMGPSPLPRGPNPTASPFVPGTPYFLGLSPSQPTPAGPGLATAQIPPAEPGQQDSAAAGAAAAVVEGSAQPSSAEHDVAAAPAGGPAPEDGGTADGQGEQALPGVQPAAAAEEAQVPAAQQAVEGSGTSGPAGPQPVVVLSRLPRSRRHMAASDGEPEEATEQMRQGLGQQEEGGAWEEGGRGGEQAQAEEPVRPGPADGEAIADAALEGSTVAWACTPLGSSSAEGAVQEGPPRAAAAAAPSAPISWAARLAAVAPAPAPVDHRKHPPQRLPGAPAPHQHQQQHGHVGAGHFQQGRGRGFSRGGERGSGRFGPGGRGQQYKGSESHFRREAQHVGAPPHHGPGMPPREQPSFGARGRGSGPASTHHRTGVRSGYAAVEHHNLGSGSSSSSSWAAWPGSGPAAQQPLQHAHHSAPQPSQGGEAGVRGSPSPRAVWGPAELPAAAPAGDSAPASSSDDPAPAPSSAPQHADRGAVAVGPAVEFSPALAVASNSQPQDGVLGPGPAAEQQQEELRPPDEPGSGREAEDEGAAGAVLLPQGGSTSVAAEAADVSGAVAAAAVASGPAGTSGEGPASEATLQALGALCREGLRVQQEPQQRVQPRGLLNPGNLCFMNSVFQALMGGSQFCGVLSALRAAGPMLDARRLPTLAAIAQLAEEFEPAAEPATQQGGSKAGAASGRAGGADVLLLGGRPLMPSMLMDLLPRFHPATNGGWALEPEQHDAQEFLNFVVDAMHQELLALRKMQGWAPGEGAGGGSGSSEEDGWLTQSGKRAVKKQEHQWVAAEAETAISVLFRGRQESSVSCAGCKPSVTVQHFTALGLHITSDQVRSVVDALDVLTAAETLPDYKPDPHSPPMPATKTVRLQRLPPILVLHLMRFEYGMTGSAKVGKHVAFDHHLAVRSSWLTKSSPDRGAGYRLVATIAHHGRRSGMGHYTADVLQPDGRTWLRFDDGNVFAVSPQTVLSDRPYLLFYQRVLRS